MESLSFLFIAIGAVLALVRRAQVGGGRVKTVEFLIVLTITLVALASWRDVFIGPVGDARGYHQTVNNCFASLPPCGTRLHEQLWGVVSAIFGSAWGVVYGISVAYAMSLLARAAEISWRSPLLLILFLYCAYQVGNGMAEGTYFLLVLVGVIAAQRFAMNTATLAFLGSLIAHLGNASFMLYLLRFPRGWPLIVIGSGLWLFFLIIGTGFSIEDIYSTVGKAGALVSEDAAISAIERKADISVRDATTSYADLLQAAGFPFSMRGFLLAVWLYLFPVVIGGSIISILISSLSTIFSLALFWLSRRDALLFAIVVLSVLMFAPASFTPGIGLRHKVPLFLFLLMANNPIRLRELAWQR